MIGSQWEILLQVFQLGAGRRVLIFPTQFGKPCRGVWA
nr:MAG TPA: hypothetical protein [Caudoviricetes sp.]DAL58747.1 MAG TPA_asm: hypothetical protein [Caudoviricetes sp.]DAM80712.1 MAG TPA: hypothetical protein [Caudoviricetes sp.]DAP45770.1 MAG TPA: hypothetical protein [Caudoviricetes sp.]DAV76218.1 MAG TPA: hypothetical protein [Caudoviricetes sp.]